jgi:ubiquinone/menaquinone biosynthesis C-methylase UbiE
MVPHNKSIDECSAEEIVNCFHEAPYGKMAEKLIQTMDSFPNQPVFDWLRITCVPYLFHWFEKNVSVTEDPDEAFTNQLVYLLHKIEDIASREEFIELFQNASGSHSWDVEEYGIADKTGIYYGNLFKDFTLNQFLEAKELLEIRLNRNNIQFNNLENFSVLDQGCGGGRYSAAWKLLGAKKVTGIDISAIGLQDAAFKAKLAGIGGIEWVNDSVLKMPFEKDTFNIVFSNGVLHHTNDWKGGLRELIRVLKPGGLGWLYLIEAPGGIFWDKVEILRAILRKVNKNYAIKVLSSLGIPNNRIFYMLDHVMVPINTRLSPQEIEEALQEDGATQISRLKRGTDFDRIEKIYQKVPYAIQKFGVAENRYVFSK